MKEKLKLLAWITIHDLCVLAMRGIALVAYLELTAAKYIGLGNLWLVHTLGFLPYNAADALHVWARLQTLLLCQPKDETAMLQGDDGGDESSFSA